MAEELVKVPDIGGEGAEVIEINVAPGDSVDTEDTVITLESDKATMEIPASAAGKVVEMLVKVGDTLKEGDDVLQLATVSEAVSETAESEPVVGTPVSEAPVSEAPVSEAPVEAAPAPVASMQNLEIRVPDIGGDKAPVVEISVAVGDEIQMDDAIATLESDKATMEIPASEAGKVTAIHVKIGDELGEGDLLVTVEGVSGSINTSVAPVSAPAPAGAPVPVKPPEPAQKPPVPPVAASNANTPVSSLVHAGPAVRRIAREFGVELGKVRGTGPKGRILKEDVQLFVKEQLSKPAASEAVAGSGLPQVPEVDFSQFGEVEHQPVNRLRQVAAQNFQRSWLNIPHVTQNDEADITELEAFRKAQKAVAEARGTRLTPLPFMLKAVAYALQEMPNFCSSLSPDGKTRILKKYVNIGIAVDTPDGLLVPVIKDVDKKGLWELAAECAEMAEKARTKKLKPAEMKGGCFTISSLGSIGGTSFTPIVNSPEVGILGISKASIKPVWNGKDFEPRLMLPLSLSYDHRAINGAEAARFAVMISTLLADIRKLLL